MYKSKQIIRTNQLLLSKIITSTFFLFLLLTYSNPIIAQGKRSNEGQWKSVGGKIAASGEHTYTNFWYASDRYHTASPGMFWKNDEDRKIPASHTSEEVNKDVVVKKGQITVQGPGFLAKFYRTKHGSSQGAKLTLVDSGEDFGTASLGRQDLLKGNDGQWKWYDNNIQNFDPTKNHSGWIPAGETKTFDVWTVNLFSSGGVWWTGFAAPKSVEYEFWFFAREGGKLISTTAISNPSKPNINIPSKPNIIPERVDVVTSGKLYDVKYDIWLTKGMYVRTWGGREYRTGKDEGASIKFWSDQADVVIKKNSQIKMYKKLPRTKKPGVRLLFGRLWSKFNPKRSKTGYAVETFNSVTGVEGTEFEVAYDPETGISSLSVTEGVVNFSCITDEKTAIKVKSGESASIDNNCRLIHTSAKPSGVIQNLTFPEIAGEWEITCNDGNIYKYHLNLVQHGKGFYGDMIRTNGNEQNSKVAGVISQYGSIEFTRSKGNWKQYYVGSIVYQSGGKVIQLKGTNGIQENRGFTWQANLINAATNNISVAGQWIVDQNNGYKGTLNLQQDHSKKITGDVIWNGYLKGIVDGMVAGYAIEYTITYPNGDIGLYKGTLTKNGLKINEGTVTGNNGVSAKWTATKSY